MKDDTIRRKAALDALGKIDCSDGVGISSLKCDAVDDAVTAIKALPSAQRWIPCSERMPRAFETVNVTVQIPEGRYVKESALVNGAWQGINAYAEVVAWCPLPAPWKGEEDE